MKLSKIIFTLISFLITIVSCNKNENNYFDTKSRLEDFIDDSQAPIETGILTPLKPVLPQIKITTKNNAPIVSKEEYVEGTISINGKTAYQDYEGAMKIKGRGNNSWSFPKKPYKIKLNKAAEIFGLPAYKEWILLAEYLDGSMLSDAIPYSMGHLLGMPFTNHIIPVELIINGQNKGIYVFTEHKEVGENRIDVGDDGLLLEFDTYLGEDWIFRTRHYKLPCVIHYPEIDSIKQLYDIQLCLEEFETLLKDSKFPNNDYDKYFDLNSLVDYMIVYTFTYNKEIYYPKSTYMHRVGKGKYKMGIIWDFDWGFGYTENGKHFDMNAVNKPLLDENSTLNGKVFFSKFMQDPKVQQRFKARWQWFRANKYNELRQYVSNYSSIIALGYTIDHAIWGKRNSTNNFNLDLNNALNWMDARANYIDNYVAGF